MRIHPINELPSTIILGRQTETGVTEVRLDCAEWLALWPGLSISVWVTPPGGDGVYPAATHMEGDVLVWPVTDADTAVAGSGAMEVLGTADGQRKLSAIATTRILATTTITQSEAPESAKPWVEEVLQAAEDVRNATGGGGSVPDPGKAHMQLVSNAIGEAEWDGRECYTSRPVVFPYQMAVDADAPSASIYATDGGADTGVRWVKVSDYAPAQNEVIGRATVFTSEYGTMKVEDENVLDVTESGYLIAREWESTSTSGLTRTLRTVYAVVCFKGGYVAHGHPGIQPADYYSSTISEPGLYLPVGIGSTVTAYGIQFDEYVQQLDEKYIPDSIARKKDLENVIIPELPEQVTDEHINALIDAKLSVFGTQTILAEQTLPGEDDDGDGVKDNFYVTGAWDTAPVVGSTYDVYYNGTKYPCEAVAMPEDAALAPGAMVMGNLAVMGLDGIVGNPDAPFAMVCLPEPMDGIVGMLMPMDGATAVTLSIRSARVGYYYYDGSRAQIVTIDQLRADLGYSGESTTDQTFYTADGSVFQTVDEAVFYVRKDVE